MERSQAKLSIYTAIKRVVAFQSVTIAKVLQDAPTSDLNHTALHTQGIL